MSKHLTAIVVSLIAVLAGCSRAPVAVKLDSGVAEQTFAPKIELQASGELTCQWVEFHKDSIGGAGCVWNAEQRKFGAPRGYGFLQREYVVCIPELERWNLQNNKSATFVAHPCIQECFMLFWNETTNKREAAWLAAPAIQTRPVQVDTLFFVAHESPTEFGLITLWIDRGGRELSRDTLDLPSPEYVGATNAGVTLVDQRDSTFSVYFLPRLCSWVDSTSVRRMKPSKQQVGTDYYMEGGGLFIVSGYRNANHTVTVETHVLNGTTLEATHSADVKRVGMGEVVAFRALRSGGNVPQLFALEQDGTRNEFWVLGLNDDGYYSHKSRAGFAVDETLQEFCAYRLNDELVLAAYTCGDKESAVANSCYAVQLEME